MTNPLSVSFASSPTGLGTSVNWEYVAAGGGGYVAIGDRSAAFSSDGKAWTVNDGAVAGGGPWQAVVYGAGTFVAIADATPNPITAIWSTDGMNWTASTSALSSVDGVWTALGFGTVGSTSYFVAIGGANNSTSYAAYSSDNGATWTKATTPLGPADWSGVAFGTVAGGSPMFVAIAGPAPGSGPSPAAYSTDGKNWVTTPMAMPANEDWASVAYGMIGSTGYFVAVSASGAAYSTDGKTWTYFDQAGRERH